MRRLSPAAAALRVNIDGIRYAVLPAARSAGSNQESLPHIDERSPGFDDFEKRLKERYRYGVGPLAQTASSEHEKGGLRSKSLVPLDESDEAGNKSGQASEAGANLLHELRSVTGKVATSARQYSGDHPTFDWRRKCLHACSMHALLPTLKPCAYVMRYRSVLTLFLLSFVCLPSLGVGPLFFGLSSCSLLYSCMLGVGPVLTDPVARAAASGVYCPSTLFCSNSALTLSCQTSQPSCTRCSMRHRALRSASTLC